MTYQSIIQEGQSLFDVTVQEYGSIEGLKHVLGDNETIESLTDLIVPGTKLNFRKSPEGINKDLMNFFRGKELKVNTGNRQKKEKGIGVWQIEQNFIVS